MYVSERLIVPAYFFFVGMLNDVATLEENHTSQPEGNQTQTEVHSSFHSGLHLSVTIR